MSADSKFPRGDRDRDRERDEQNEFDERVVFVNRCAKVVKGGRRMSFSAVVVVGDRQGKVGFGFGKANEVADAIRKGGEAAKKSLFSVKMDGRTIPHQVVGVCDGGRVLIKPAPAGSGLIVGGGMRPVLEAAGVRDAVGKSLGSKNRLNVVKATIDALNQLRSAEEIAAARA
ncbi:MAG: 30S ribosomal protein S5 [Kiritimatiellae bacterium]|nr:30S ribosomal protein S5 [Kiritimatiellia bacterium]